MTLCPGAKPPGAVCLDAAYSTTRTILLEDGVQSWRSAPEPVVRLEAREGGLRRRGYRKVGDRDLPLVTIVTVVYNGAAELAETIASVLDLDYDNIEYVIVDGGSTDGTLDVIRAHEHAIDYWVSGPDGGIYDAMNKGLALARGDWINFMNAGDRFAAPDALGPVLAALRSGDPDIVYGDHEVRYATGRTRRARAGRAEELGRGSRFCHQAVFVRTAFHRGRPFDTAHRLVADFAFFHASAREGARFRHVPAVICSFEAGGASDTSREEAILGFWRIVGRGPRADAWFMSWLIAERLKAALRSVLRLMRGRR